MAPSPIVDLNRAFALASSGGPDAGLALLDTVNLDAQLGESHIQYATRAELLCRADRPVDALPHYRHALELAPPTPSAATSSGAWLSGSQRVDPIDPQGIRGAERASLSLPRRTGLRCTNPIAD